MFDSIKTRLAGRRAYTRHVQGNQLIEKGELEEGRKKHLEALELYEQALQTGHCETQVLMAYAVLLMRFDQCEKAKQILLECEKRKDLDAKSRKQLRVDFAVCQWKLGDLDKAIENMEMAASSGKTSAIYGTLGYFYIEKGRLSGDFTRAIEFNNEAMQYDEEDAAILDNMGQLHYFMGDPDKAYEYFSRAYAAKPSQVATLYYIAKINLERKNYEKAQAFIDRCVEGNFSALATITREQAKALQDEIRSSAQA